jgi:quercetin dioxygenase-like cupin family protein
MSLSTSELKQFLAELAASPLHWAHHVRHSPEGRVYEQIWDEEDVNAWVICWSDGQDTGFHDHDDSAAAILVVDGHVREERLRLGAPPRTRVMGPGSSFVVPPTAIHRVFHDRVGPAVTLHAYSPPLRRTGAYRIGPDGLLERAVQQYERELRAEPSLS